MQGYELVRGHYRRKAMAETGSLLSSVLGLELRPEGVRLRFFDPVAGEGLLTPEEEALRRLAAEAELMRLRAELERRR